jgi:hydrogenase maturation protein HypF
MALGGHLKNTIAVSAGQEIFLSQHIGDLDTKEAYKAFQQVVSDFQNLYGVSPESLACDAHPDYRSTQFARQKQLPVISVQHHYAHVLSCMSEHNLEGSVLGIAWDGSGYGLDGTVWGGEFLHVNQMSFARTAHFRTFQLPGGEKPVKEPRRAAVGLLYEIFGDDLFKLFPSKS